MLFYFIFALVPEVVPIIFGLKLPVSYSGVVNESKIICLHPLICNFIFSYFCLFHCLFSSCICQEERLLGCIYSFNAQISKLVVYRKYKAECFQYLLRTLFLKGKRENDTK